MRIVAWNIRWGGKDRPAIARAVAALNPDVAILTEYRPAGRRGDLVEDFTQLGWPHHLLVHETAMPDLDLGRKPKKNGILAVARVPIEPGDISGPPDRPASWLHLRVPSHDIEIAGVRLLVGKKLGRRGLSAQWAWLTSTAASVARRRLLVVGDLNTSRPKAGVRPRKGGPEEALVKLLAAGWRDVAFDLDPVGKSFWAKGKETGVRIDYALASPGWVRPFASARYVTDHEGHVFVGAPGARGVTPPLSDHAALVVDLVG